LPESPLQREIQGFSGVFTKVVTRKGLFLSAAPQAHRVAKALQERARSFTGAAEVARKARATGEGGTTNRISSGPLGRRRIRSAFFPHASLSPANAALERRRKRGETAMEPRQLGP